MARVFLFSLWLFVGTAPAQDVGTVPETNPPIYALKGATVMVGNGGVVEGGTVVINDGLIEAVGLDLPIPPGAWEFDLSGMYIYPGLIDGLTSVGIRQRSADGSRARGTRSQASQQSAPSEEGPGFFAHVSGADLLDEKEASLASWRSAGVLALNVVPDEGIFRGVTALVNLNGRDPDQMIVASNLAMNMSFQGLGFRSFPGSLMGVIAHIRQTLSDAAHYRSVWKTYSENKRGLKRPETNRTLEALQPVIEGRMPLVFPAKLEREILRSLGLCGEFEVRCIVAGGFEAAAVADQLREANVPVLVSLNHPAKARDAHPEAEESLSEVRFRAAARTAAAALNQARVRFAFYSDGVSAGDFLGNLRKAVANGLPKEAALRAATLVAAEILGVEEQLGSIETGKIANLVVSDGDLFEDESQIRHVFVDGVHFPIPVGEKGKKGRPGAAPGPVSGDWEVAVTSPDYSTNMTFELSQRGERLEGRVITRNGSVEIYDGSVTGENFSFKIEFSFVGGQTEITMSGKVSGNSLTGTVVVGDLGTADFKGRRLP